MDLDLLTQRGSSPLRFTPGGGLLPDCHPTPSPPQVPLSWAPQLPAYPSALQAPSLAHLTSSKFSRQKSELNRTSVLCHKRQSIYFLSSSSLGSLVRSAPLNHKTEVFVRWDKTVPHCSLGVRTNECSSWGHTGSSVRWCGVRGAVGSVSAQNAWPGAGGQRGPSLLTLPHTSQNAAHSRTSKLQPQ